MSKKVLHTIYGKAIIEKGYYRIITNEKGHFGEYLHRVIFENFYNVKILPNVHIHHIDGNKLNNCIMNLEAITKSKHHKMHSTGEEFSLSRRLNIGNPENKSGYFRVYVHKCKHCKQGFRYVYEFSENNKRNSVSSITIEGLEKKVKDKGWIWIKYDESTGNITEK